MTKQFCITVDVVMSGDIYIEASSEEEARKKAEEKYFVPSDLTNFHYLSKEIYEINEEE